jgi:predicted DNA-binding ribbon-helix-helix protein
MRITSKETAMCSIFRRQNTATYAAETRAIRLSGHATSIRLEAAFWDILEQIAAHEDMTLGRFVSTLHDEILFDQGKVQNFASLLRVTCTHYLQNRDAYLTEVATRRPRQLVA